MCDAALRQAWRPDRDAAWVLDQVACVRADGRVAFAAGADGAAGAVAALGEVHRVDASHLEDLSNAADMNNAHEAPLLDLLRRRYRQRSVYTWTGEILISVNPYETVEGLGTLPESSVETGPSAAPHLHTVAARALEQLRVAQAGGRASLEQTIIINGESGAGKTEASKIILRYLQHEAGSRLCLQDLLLEANVLLEAFGNARTARNDNSSRFGKFMRVQYDAARRLRGAHISHFLLESSRLVSRGSADESNFHVLYAVSGLEGVAGAAASYRYLQGTGCPGATAPNAPGAWPSVAHSLRRVGLSDAQVSGIARMLAAVLELGNVKVTERSLAAGAAAAAAAVGSSENLNAAAGNSSNSANVRVAYVDPEQPALLRAAELLGVDAGELRRTLSCKTALSNQAHATSSWVELGAAQAQESIHSLAKHIYVTLFDWVVMQVNLALAARAEGDQPERDEEARAVSCGVTGGCIGILDIYGFEIFRTNSLEQLFINFANERLQRQFNGKVFDAEQQRYLAEGVKWSVLEFGVDNQPCIDLIGNSKLSLLSILDEQTLMLYHAQGVAGAETDSHKVVEEQLLAKMHKSFAKHSHYAKPRIAGATFQVRHFAGLVEYDICGFPRKNQDPAHEGLVLILSSSHDPFLQQLVRRESEAVRRDIEERDVQIRKRVFETNAVGDSELDRKFLRRRASRGIMYGAGADAGGSPFSSGKFNELDAQQLLAAENLFSEDAMAKCSAGQHLQPQQKWMSSRSQFGSVARNTIASRYRQQLSRLVEILDAAAPHYVRCIKPNSAKAPMLFDSSLVLDQLRCIGVLETVRIRKQGFPVRIAAEELERLLATLLRAGGGKSMRDVLDEQLPEGSWQLGMTSVFLKDRALEHLLAAAAALAETRSTRLQALVRARQRQRQYARLRSATVALQTAARARTARAELARLEESRRARQQRELAAARVLQNWIRVTINRHKHDASIVVQAAARRMLSVRLAARRSASAKKLGRALRALWRNRVLRLRLAKLHGAAGGADAQAFAEACDRAVSELWALEAVRFGPDLRTLLHSAVSSGLVAHLELMLAPGGAAQHLQGADWPVHKAVDANGNTALHLAARLPGGRGFEVCSRLVDAVAGCAMLTDDADAPSVHAPLPQSTLRGTLLKRRNGSSFKSRFVELDPSKGTLSYRKNARERDARLTVELTSERCTLKINERHPNCFEVVSPNLLTSTNKGSVLFKCKDQRELQLWLSALRQVRSLNFNTAIPEPSMRRVQLTRWNRASALVHRLNRREESALHVAAEFAHLSTTLYLLSLASTRGAPQLLAALHRPDSSGLTPKQRAERSGLLQVSNAFDRLGAYANVAPAQAPAAAAAATGRSSIVGGRPALDKARRGGTFLSLFLNQLAMPASASDCGAVSLCVSVVHVAADKQQPAMQQSEENATTAPLAPMHSVRKADLVEEQVVLRPLHWAKSEQGTTVFNFGALWNMQTPLEQLGSTACVVLHVRSGERVLSSATIPFSPRTIGTGALAAGLQTLYPCTASPSGAALSLGQRLLASLGHAPKMAEPATQVHANERAPAKALPALGLKVSYSLRSEACVNCFST
jgi:hypothetical protein